MEHAALHALELLGLVVALGGTVFMLAIFRPAVTAIGADAAAAACNLGCQLERSITRWVFLGALIGAVASFLNIFVNVAEAEYRTIFGGVSLDSVWRYLTITSVGNLKAARIAALVLTAAAVRIRGQAKWWLVLAFALTATTFAGLVCHASALPVGRATAMTLEYVHIIGAAVWIGPLIHLLLARRFIESATAPSDTVLLAEVVRRFSPMALCVVILIAVSGAVAAARFLVGPSAVATSAYGLTLVVKLIFIVPLVYAGWINFRVIRPALINLNSGPGSAFHEPPGRARHSVRAVSPIPVCGAHGVTRPTSQALLKRFGRTLELEVTAGVLVLVVAGILASVSPPRGEAELLLSGPQARALYTSVHLPQTQLVNPAAFYGAVERTVDDLRYAEFTHNWSGVAVCVLGLCWLLQNLGGRKSVWAARIWPLSLVPFGLFIAVAADPEVWILRTTSLAEAFTDPTLVGHQLAALLVFALAWLGWHDAKRPSSQRPLGYALPALMILGSLLLLGHAHANYNTSQELTNLINVQHAYFGMFGLFAGTIRWLELRGLFPARVSRIAWPGCIIALGLFMTFCYREVV